MPPAWPGLLEPVDGALPRVRRHPAAVVPVDTDRLRHVRGDGPGGFAGALADETVRACSPAMPDFTEAGSPPCPVTTGIAFPASPWPTSLRGRGCRPGIPQPAPQPGDTRRRPS
ncbi:hypothetical protein KNE206_66990 [Kitasatospora sp. NE20-6]